MDQFDDKFIKYHCVASFNNEIKEVKGEDYENTAIEVSNRLTGDVERAGGLMTFLKIQRVTRGQLLQFLNEITEPNKTISITAHNEDTIS
jgi:hypothetical protein